MNTNQTKAFSTTAVVLLLGPLLAGCAKLDYVKVPTPTQYSTWTDAQQRAADNMQGVRYYLPRPFLHLKQSTPVSQRTGLVSYRWDSESESYVLELPELSQTWLRKIAPRKISLTQAAALMLHLPPEGPRKTGGIAGTVPQSLTTPGGETPEPSRTDSSGSSGPDTASQPPTTPSEIKARTGFINNEDPVTRLGDRMDIVYLPDFEEQFVIRSQTGLGKADIETRLRNGWAAETFSQQADNSTLIPYVIDQVSKASDAAANIFMTWAPAAAGLPPGITKVPAEALARIAKNKLEGGNSGGEPGAIGQDVLGGILLIKVSEVRIAQPGIYPILKPREIRQWLHGQPQISNDPDLALDVLIMSSGVPWIRSDMAFIPCPPVTMIGFNTTSDVFIAPATSPVAVASNSSSDGDNATSEQPRLSLATKLFDPKNAENFWTKSISDRIELKDSTVSNANGRNGNHFEITVAVKNGQSLAEEEVLGAFKARFNNPGINWTAARNAADSSITITGTETIQTLLEQFK
ncbi:MAG: hypothetical protein KF791_03580 [Verrucomicrobiae bacterium]|nr:hypothetical protein [Verrucomicrobiae bacterium]